MATEEDRLYHPGAASVVDWMIRQGRHSTHMREFGDEMCRRTVAAGIPLMRAFCSVETLHPEISATAYVWRHDESGAVRRIVDHDFMSSERFRTSPIAVVQKSGLMIRRKVEDPQCPIDFPFVEEFRAEGGTDYVAMPMRCSSGLINCITWQTSRGGGFSETEIEGLKSIAEALGLIVELQSTRRIASHLLDTYVGHRTGERVLSGVITRGSGEQIRAVIWFADIRGFTTLADRLDRDNLISLLNDYFQIMVEAVAAEGGETLKFMGDAILAIFELRPDENPAALCSAALRAANDATAKITARNLERQRQGDPEIKCGLALHLGEVSYGNIGARTRLDFTVIGPAVNHAARLEKLASQLGRAVVTSASFAKAASESLESLGVHQLRGVSEPQEVFAPTRQARRGQYTVVSRRIQMSKARAAMQVGDRKFELAEFDLPRIGPEDGLLRIEACGMCGSDVEQYEGALKAIGVNYPVIPGHEPFGFIEEVGANAALRWGVKKGDRVVIEPILGCGHCRACLTGAYRRCRTGRAGSGVPAYGYIPTSVAPSLWGGYAQYMYLDPHTVMHKVAPELPAELIALYQPMAAGIRWAVHEPATKIGDTVVILGCGQRGLTSIVAAREAGAGKVIATGLKADAHKLALAREFGADATIVADQEDTVARVRELTNGEGADVVVDVSAVSVQPIVDAIEIAKTGATIVIAGVKGSGRTVPNFVSDKLLMKELTIKGVLSQDIRAFEPALKLIAARKYPLEKMHTQTFALDQVDLAVRTLAGHVENTPAIHVMVAP